MFWKQRFQTITISNSPNISKDSNKSSISQFLERQTYQRMQKKKELTLVYYYVPQDNDDPEYPNVFGIMIPKNTLTLQNIIDNFPLSGTYIFRFKANYGGVIVWEDFQQKGKSVPTFKDKLYLKVTRVSWETHSPFKFMRAPMVKEKNPNSVEASLKKVKTTVSKSNVSQTLANNFQGNQKELKPPKTSLDLINNIFDQATSWNSPNKQKNSGLNDDFLL